jgi:hypothetical protein
MVVGPVGCSESIHDATEYLRVTFHGGVGWISLGLQAQLVAASIHGR